MSLVIGPVAIFFLCSLCSLPAPPVPPGLSPSPLSVPCCSVLFQFLLYSVSNMNICVSSLAYAMTPYCPIFMVRPRPLKPLHTLSSHSSFFHTRHARDPIRGLGCSGSAGPVCSHRPRPQPDPVCKDLREDGAEAGAEGAVAAGHEHHGEDHRAAAAHRPDGEAQGTCRWGMWSNGQQGQAT